MNPVLERICSDIEKVKAAIASLEKAIRDLETAQMDLRNLLNLQKELLTDLELLKEEFQNAEGNEG